MVKVDLALYHTFYLPSKLTDFIFSFYTVV